MLATVLAPSFAPAPTPMAGAFLSLQDTNTWVLVSFIIFIAIVAYAGAFGAIGRALDARAERIRAELDEARRLREEAQAKLAEFERKHQEVERQAADIVESAKKSAQAAAEEAKASIADSVAKRLRAAEEQLAIAKSDAVRAVRNEAVDAAVGAARTVLKAELGSGENAALIDAAIGDVATRVH